VVVAAVAVHHRLMVGFGIDVVAWCNTQNDSEEQDTRR
jgi:hypothetical protein